MTVRVLVAEDDEDHAFFTVRAIRDAHGVSVEVDTVRDGEEALEYLHKRGRYADRQRPDLVVLDLKMPKRGGIEVLGEIKRSPDLHAIPVVMLSSSDRVEDVAGSYDSGCNSYVTKPTTLSGLRSGVRDLAKYWLDVAVLPPRDGVVPAATQS